MLFKLVSYYLIGINILGYILMGIDKNQALQNKWRIKETTLFKTAVYGGSVGIWLGMKNFRHKTKHKKFTDGIPAIFVLQVIVIVVLCILIAYYN